MIKEEYVEDHKNPNQLVAFHSEPKRSKIQEVTIPRPLPMADRVWIVGG